MKEMLKQRNFPKIMGIVNVTPDSLSDGGRYFSPEIAIQHARQLIADGADILDIGGESTRPGAEPVDENDEIQRIFPVVSALHAEFPHLPISIDTVKYAVAQAALEAGATIINDISGLTIEPRLAELAAKSNAELVIMHIQGTPRTMQTNPQYANVVRDIFEVLSQKISFARHCGVEKIYADVGIGFGKTVEHNLLLLKNHREFRKLGVPLLLGISRKSFFGKTLGIETPSDRDSATLAAHLLLGDCGAEIIRVHNVKIFHEARRLFQLFDTTEIHEISA